MSDLHIDSSNEEIYGINPLQNLQRSVSALKEIKDITIGVITGDISNDGRIESYMKADEVLSQLPFPILITNGNHDDAEALLNTDFHKMRYEPFYTFNNTDFITVNTVVKAEDGRNRSSGIITRHELSLLKDRIIKSRNKIIILMHHPATPTESWLDKRILSNREDFYKTIALSQNIIAVLSGHNHYSTTVCIRSILFCTAPSVSTTFDKDLKPFEEAFKPGFNIINTDNGICTVETIYL